MKKFLLIMAVAGFIACNNKSDKKETTTDTTKSTTVDTASKMAPDTTAKMSADTTKK